MDEHCKDCCCAHSWKALGITEYTGKSISEHITALRAEIARLAAENAKYRDALWVCVEHNALHFGEAHNTVIQGRAALAQGEPK